MTAPRAIEVRDLRKRFGELKAVDGVSFDVGKGELFGLLGPNGAGKSTLIRMLTTLIEPTSGSALVAGHDVNKDPNAVRLAIGVIPQNMTSDPDLTCAENLSIHARLYGLPKAQRRTVTLDLLQAVGQGDRADAFAGFINQVHQPIGHGGGPGGVEMTPGHRAETRSQPVVVIDIGEPVPVGGRPGEGGVERAVDAAGRAGIGNDQRVAIARLQRCDHARRCDKDVKQRDALRGNRGHGFLEVVGHAESRRDHENQR